MVMQTQSSGMIFTVAADPDMILRSHQITAVVWAVSLMDIITVKT